MSECVEVLDVVGHNVKCEGGESRWKKKIRDSGSVKVEDQKMGYRATVSFPMQAPMQRQFQSALPDPFNPSHDQGGEDGATPASLFFQSSGQEPQKVSLADWTERAGMALGCTNSSTAERNLMRGGRGTKQVLQFVTASVKTCIHSLQVLYVCTSPSFHVCVAEATSSTSKRGNIFVEMNQWLPRKRGSTFGGQIGLRHPAGGVLGVV